MWAPKMKIAWWTASGEATTETGYAHNGSTLYVDGSGGITTTAGTNELYDAATVYYNATTGAYSATDPSAEYANITADIDRGYTLWGHTLYWDDGASDITMVDTGELWDGTVNQSGFDDSVPPADLYAALAPQSYTIYANGNPPNSAEVSYFRDGNALYVTAEGEITETRWDGEELNDFWDGQGNIFYNAATGAYATEDPWSSVDLTQVDVEIPGADAGVNKSNISDAITQLDNARSILRSESQKLSTNLSAITIRQEFTTGMINTLEDGAAELTNADMNEEGANMLMLQTRQSLGTTSLSLASQAAQSVLRLF